MHTAEIIGTHPHVEGNTNDAEIYHSRAFAQFQMGFAWTIGFSPGKHPLAR